MNKLFLSLAVLSMPLFAATPAGADKDCCKAGKTPCCSEKCCKAGAECCKGSEHKGCSKECKDAPAAPKS